MKKIAFAIFLLALYSACGKQESNTCISPCNTSTPGKINIAIEEHTDLDINTLFLTINEQKVPFDLLVKARQGQHSCWKTFDKVDNISLIQFNLGLDSTYAQVVNYQNLSNRDYALDIRLVNEDFRIQLVENPDCIFDKD